MPINIQYVPPYATVGRAAYRIGRGQYLETEEERRRQEAEKAETRRLRREALAQEGELKRESLAAQERGESARLKVQAEIARERMGLEREARAMAAAERAQQQADLAGYRQASIQERLLSERNQEQFRRASMRNRLAEDFAKASGIPEGYTITDPQALKRLQKIAQEYSAVLDARVLSDEQRLPRAVLLQQEAQSLVRTHAKRIPDPVAQERHAEQVVENQRRQHEMELKRQETEYRDREARRKHRIDVLNTRANMLLNVEKQLGDYQMKLEQATVQQMGVGGLSTEKKPRYEEAEIARRIETRRNELMRNVPAEPEDPDAEDRQMATIMGRIRNVMARRTAGETLAENEEKALTLFQNRYPDRYNEIAADLARERWGTP